MRNGVFKPTRYGAYARATNAMSTESATNFEWSVKFVGKVNFLVGIASQLKPEMMGIFEYAILLNTSSNIQIGSKTINSSLLKYKSGDVIRFRFQPHVKKLAIDLVRN